MMHAYIKLWADIRGIQYSDVKPVTFGSVKGFIHASTFHEILMDETEVAILRCLFRDGVRIVNKPKSRDIIGVRRKKKTPVNV